MTPGKFIAKWKAADLSEKASAQAHFIDLCALLSVHAPYEEDQTDAEYAFEKGTQKIGGGRGWADVWKKDCFGWEYKRKGQNLDAALDQLKRYALALDNPPLLIVSDITTIRIHTNWTSTVSKKIEISLDDLADADKRDLLKAAFSTKSVGQLKPGETRQALTEEAAKKLADLAHRLRERKHDARDVAHFIQRLVFCMFAEDVKLLPNEMFMRTLKAVRAGEGNWDALSRALFKAMKSGGHLGLEKVAYFNGGLFEDLKTLPLDQADVKLLIDVADKYWGDIDPTIFGTLFERGLDPDKRSQLGAHYTDTDKIMRIVDPVVVRPLTAEWETTRSQIEKEMARAQEQDRKRTAAGKGDATKAIKRARELYRGFRKRLHDFRVLDPACGSGNFLYLALHALMDIEHRAGIDVEQLGLQRELPSVGPENVKGLEINPFAAELARVTIWIGWLQWMRRNGMTSLPEPILSVLEQIENRDAVLNRDGTQSDWPKADVIVGNPPFLGANSMIGTLGEKYVTKLRQLYEPMTGGAVDLVTYWLAKAWSAIETGSSVRAGFVATQAIRRGSSQVVLGHIVDNGRIFDAWDDEPWVVDGASVRVSLLCFEKAQGGDARLDGAVVEKIAADLSAGSGLRGLEKLRENSNVAFQGPVKVGAFDVEGDEARRWLKLPKNPNGKSNAAVLRPWANGSDISGRSSGKWIIDFADMEKAEAALFEAPFKHVVEHVKPERDGNRRERRRLVWWQHGETVPGLRRAAIGLKRLIVTPRVSKHRIFAWMHPKVLPDTRLVVVARDDDTTFGLLHSKFHEAWSLKLGGWHGVGNDPQYTPSLGFETFPMPEGLAPNIASAKYEGTARAKAIAKAAAELNEKREAWLNPSELVNRVPEVVAGFPDRVLPVDAEAAEILKKRTLTNLYNERPTWLSNLHDTLDRAVALAYGWPGDISSEEALHRLFALNRERAEK